VKPDLFANDLGSLYQVESISSLGSGTVKSLIKQIGTRVKLSGAQWNIESVSSILSLRCAYLNGQLST
jgi:hypothetical protein